MQLSYPTSQEAATPEYVLDLIRDRHRQQSQFDPEADHQAELTFESTVAEWRDVCGLLGWYDLARALNEAWNIDRPLSEWALVLEPAQSRTLRQVCTFAAAHMLRNRIRPACLLGMTCSTAGAFLTIRSILSSSGVDARYLRPSTPLDEYARSYPGLFLGPISALAPGRLPTVIIERPGYNQCAGVYGLSLVGTCIMAALGRPWLASVCVALTLGSYLGIWIFAYRPPKRVIFGSLQTFCDLARILAEE